MIEDVIQQPTGNEVMQALEILQTFYDAENGDEMRAKAYQMAKVKTFSRLYDKDRKFGKSLIFELLTNQ